MIKKINFELTNKKPEQIILSLTLLILFLGEMSYQMGKAFYYFTH